MAITTTISISIALIGLLLIAHRVSTHLRDPLKFRKYPTLNLLCGFTNLGYIYALWRTSGFRTKELFKAHAGKSVIRIGPNALSSSDVGAINDIYGHISPCLKGDMYSTPAGLHRSLLDCVDKQEHSEKRRRVAAAFATKLLEDWEHKVADKCRRLIAQFDQRCCSDSAGTTEIFDFRKWSNLFTVDAIADIALSEHLGLPEAGDDVVVAMDESGHKRQVHFIQSLHGLGRMVAPIVWSSHGYGMLKRLLSYLSGSYRTEIKNNTTFDHIVRRLTAIRLQRYDAGETLDDFVTCLLEDK